MSRSRRLPSPVSSLLQPVTRMSQDDSAPTSPKNGGPRRGRSPRGDSPRKGARRPELAAEQEAAAETGAEPAVATAEAEAPDVEEAAVEGDATPDAEIMADAGDPARRGRRRARARGCSREGEGGRAQPPRSRDPQGDEHPEARQGGEGARHPRGAVDEEAGAGLPDPACPGRARGTDLLRGRPRDPSRRFRLPPGARVLLLARPGRHLRLSLTDPQVRSAYRRHHQRTDPSAQGRRALLRPHQGRRRQLRAAGPCEGEDLLRQPDPALSRGADPPRDDAGPADDAGDGSPEPARQGPAGPHRRRPPHRARR